MKKQGFTLIELLVVIVIIGILASITAASYRSYFYRAWNTERETSVRNMGNIILTANAVDHIESYNPASNMGEFGIGVDAKSRILDVLKKEASYLIPSVTTAGFNYYYLYKTDDFVIINCKQNTGKLVYYGTAQAITDVVNQQSGGSPICSTAGVDNSNFPGGYIGTNLSS